MDPDVIDLQTKKIKQSLENVSAKVADAVEMTQQAKILFVDSEAKLTQAGLELEELYLMISEGPQAFDE